MNENNKSYHIQFIFTRYLYSKNSEYLDQLKSLNTFLKKNKIVPDIVVCSKSTEAINSALTVYNEIVDFIYPVPFMNESFTNNIIENSKINMSLNNLNLVEIEYNNESEIPNFDHLIKYALPHIINKINKINEYHWTNFFINKINDKVKLVGTTIVCLPPTDAGGYGPKVEGFFFMVDHFGLELLKEEKTIFCDHETKELTVIKSEYGLSNCILKRGYSIDCMIRKYQGIDWTDKIYWNLNNYKHPSRNKSFFGNSINPYELIFHKWFWYGDTVNLEIIQQYVNNNT